LTLICIFFCWLLAALSKSDDPGGCFFSSTTYIRLALEDIIPLGFSFFMFIFVFLVAYSWGFILRKKRDEISRMGRGVPDGFNEAISRSSERRKKKRGGCSNR
jgi:hypothetical protein